LPLLGLLVPATQIASLDINAPATSKLYPEGAMLIPTLPVALFKTCRPHGFTPL
jgi:hypothetical protein